MKDIVRVCLTVLLITIFCSPEMRGEGDKRAQLPSFMKGSYFEVNYGHIDYPFGADILEPGFIMRDVTVRHPAVRLVLMGKDLNRYLAAQITYMRPVWWVRYNYSGQSDIQSSVKSSSVWMNVAGLTLKPKIPIGERFTLYGEGGLGIITRHGIKEESGDVVVKDIVSATTNFGAGIYYRLNEQWSLQISSSYTSSVKKHNQPYTTFVGGGFKYSFTPFSEEKLLKASQTGRIHPKQWLQISLSSNAAGYGVNDLLRKAYLFWGGGCEVKTGVMFSYKRNLFHSPKVFALDIGANGAIWNSNRDNTKFFALSVYPVFRFNLMHTKLIDPYLFYILGGPAYISQSFLDGVDTGKNFTFYDAIGMGGFFGKDRRFNAELSVAHYSNGNIFPYNGGVKIPLTFTVGYCF